MVFLNDNDAREPNGRARPAAGPKLRRGAGRRRGWPLLVVLGLVAGVVTAEISRETQLKAVVLWRFSEFVEWPNAAFASREAPLVVGILGHNPFGDTLEIAVRGQNAQDRPLTVRYYQRPEQVRDCQILYLGVPEAELDRILQQFQGRPVLTVGDSSRFAERGGMIGLGVQANRLRLRINLQAAEQSGLRLSSKLLRMAEIVAVPPP